MKLYEAVTLLVGGVLVAWVGYGLLFESNIEQPSFEKIKNNHQLEIRKYNRILMVGHQMSVENQSFRRLFRYIDGGNQASQKIPMTAPVIDDQSSMMFVMPDSMEIAPTPNDPSLSVIEEKGLIVAVKSFRGAANQADTIKNDFENELKSKGVTATGRWFLCQFNSPWVFPLLRKNEIWMVIEI